MGLNEDFEGPRYRSGIKRTAQKGGNGTTIHANGRAHPEDDPAWIEIVDLLRVIFIKMEYIYVI